MRIPVWPLHALALAALAAAATPTAGVDLVFERADHLVIVSVDGLRAGAVSAETTPNLAAMLPESAFSRHARTIVPSLTMPSHTSMLTGLEPAEHGVLWNSYDPARAPIAVRTVFQDWHEAGRTTALFAGKKKLIYLARPQFVDIVYAENEADDVAVMDRALAAIAQDPPGLTVIHLPAVDHVGHAKGWMSPEQLDAIAEADRQIGRLMGWVRKLCATSSWRVLVTADHGGHGTSHGSAQEIDRAIPWILWGVERPRELPALLTTETARMARRVLSGEPAR